MARERGPLARRARALGAPRGWLAALVLGCTALTALPGARAAGRPAGHDVSSHQGDVDWASARSRGASFVYVKATESTSYRNPSFGQQYGGALRAGLLRGAYHFAVPDQSSGRAQAAFFVTNGGAWRDDGRTLPPAVDLEHNPYGKDAKDARAGDDAKGSGGDACYGLTPAAMSTWIAAFSDEVRLRTGRRPVIYTSTAWWNACTGHSRAFAGDHPLWLARYAATPGALPAGWSYWTFWQHANGSGILPGDQDLFNGTPEQLKRFAAGR
ncbi:lysozyme [Streptomyces sp. NPDC006711]|uniref:lysozyme n=1 Tax=unclassified Streptomyces TaxID=2593676 RepID=UPI0033E308D1